MSGARSRRAGRSVPALYGALTTGLVALVVVVASVVVPATPPTLAELSPSARDRIEEARDDQGIGTGDGEGGSCAPGDATCLESQGTDPSAGPGSDSGIAPALQVAAGRRCFGDPPRQTEDPHSPPCVFEIFAGDNGGATARGVTATEIRVAVEWPTVRDATIVEALFAHFNLRYEFYGRRLSPVFVPPYSDGYDPASFRAHADELIAAEPFAVSSWWIERTSAALYGRLAQAGVVSAVAGLGQPAFGSDAMADGLTWLVDPPLDVRLRAGASWVCRAFNGRPASHAGADVRATTTSRRFAVLVVTEPARPDPGPLESGLRGCGADFEIFDILYSASQSEWETLMLQLKSEGFTTVLVVDSTRNLSWYPAATSVGYFPEWLDLGMSGSHTENFWAGTVRAVTGGHGEHAFGITPEVRVRPDAEVPAVWALREGGGGLDRVNGPVYVVEPLYRTLLVLASGIQGAGPNLTPETFAHALRTMDFPNPNPGAPPYWQQRIGFGPGDQVFHDDYAIWWWNEDAPSQTSGSSSGQGSFCYLDRGARFTAAAFPADTDSRLFSASEPCR